MPLRARSRRAARVLAVLVALLAPALVLTSVVAGPTTGAATRSAPVPVLAPTGLAGVTVPVSAPVPDDRPDVVLVLIDDFSTELLRTMPNATRLARQGAVFTNSFVVDSMCCPSRAALLTGRLPHQTGVRTNEGGVPGRPIGGWAAFRRNGNVPEQFAVALRSGGYRTGFVGKYLNGYGYGSRAGRPPPRVPGWDDWDVISTGGYDGWGFHQTVLRDGVVRTRPYPVPPRSTPLAERDRSYATHVVARLARRLLRRHADGDRPYFLEVATYGTHGSLRRAYPTDPPFPPAFADRARPGRPASGNCGRVPCGALRLRDLVGYDDPRGDNRPTYLRGDGGTAPAPPWRTSRTTLSDAQALARYRDRARMAQSVDRMIGQLHRAAPDAYLVITSDNGFHLGQHRLNGGKGTPYDSDTRVPLVVVGPGVVPGPRRQFVSNIDLAPTFEELAGLTPRPTRSGRSFARLLRDPGAPGGGYAFVEHTVVGARSETVDADRASGGAIGTVPSYVAIRGPAGLLARFDLDKGRGTRYGWELYRYDAGFEKTNVFARDHTEPYARDLMRRLLLAVDCAPAECRRATRAP